MKLHYDLEERLDTVGVVSGSRAWIRQVFEILVDNAVEAMLTTDSPMRELTVSTRVNGEKVEVSVRDTGPGIPPDFLEHIFKTPKDKPEGSRGAGIGLMLADTIVRTYGGEIRVGPTGADGTTMTLIMPMRKLADHGSGGI